MRFSKQEESPLDRLEREANDDFLLLEELGPEYFGGSHLLELHERVRLRLAQFDRLRRLNTLVGATAAGWMLLGVVLVLVGWITPARVAFAVMGVSLLGFLAGVWLLKWKFESRGELEFTLRTIEEELRRRAATKGRSARL
ncbi:MAG: hypothetical protein IPM98_15765 [Lewinellaceae bacterium]|nr:hypothetical protein [Lewinellaceae bacterium]